MEVEHQKTGRIRSRHDDIRPTVSIQIACRHSVGRPLVVAEGHWLIQNPLHYALALACAATALRASEILALRWADMLWLEGVEQRQRLGRLPESC